MQEDIVNNKLHRTSSKAEYYKIEDKYRTNKIIIMDISGGVLSLSLCILLITSIFNIKKFSDFNNIICMSKSNLIFFANVFWLGLIPSTYWYYTFRGGRGDYPHFADSIGIPIFQQTTAVIYMLIPLNIYLVISLNKSLQPSKLFQFDRQYSQIHYIWEIFFGISLMINIAILIGFIFDGDHFSIPITLFYTYLILSLRNGKINYFNNLEKK